MTTLNSTRPVMQWNEHGVSVAIWKRAHEGATFYDISISRSYKKAETWHRTSNSRCSPTHSLQLHHAFMTTVCRPPLRSLRDMDCLEEATENLGGTPPADARKTHVSFPTACAAFLRLSLRVAR